MSTETDTRPDPSDLLGAADVTVAIAARIAEESLEERDRARATAVALEQENARLLTAVNAVRFGVGPMGRDEDSSFDRGFNAALRAVRDRLAEHLGPEDTDSE